MSVANKARCAVCDWTLDYLGDVDDRPTTAVLAHFTEKHPEEMVQLGFDPDAVRRMVLEARAERHL